MFGRILCINPMTTHAFHVPTGLKPDFSLVQR